MKEPADARDHADQAYKHQINVGDSVLVKHDSKPAKLDTPYVPKSYTVDKKRGTMIIAKRGDHTVTRNSSCFKRIPKSCDHNVPTLDEIHLEDIQRDSVQSEWMYQLH
jgi:hypothetical protein